MSQNNDFASELASIERDLSGIDKAIEKLSRKRTSLLARKRQVEQCIQQKASEELANQNWERSDHPWSKKVSDTLKSMFRMDRFRPHQLSTINAVMSKQDCILLMPTGGGKSLCYQLPAMVLEGITLVVSPLVSLMEDQIMAMEALNVPAAMLNANSTREHVNHVHKQMTEKNPTIKLLYVTPEKLAKSKRFMAKLEKMYKMGQFSLLAIDEVHCCSQWGHDFRTDYKFLGIMKRQFPKVPILGLTATATASIISDVQNILNIPGCLVLKASFNRPNLKYEVACKSSCQKDNVSELESLLKNRFNGLSGIIYCFSIKDCEEIASELRKRGIQARAYHAQLSAPDRSRVHRGWASNATQVIVATVAFGMGIDKPDVRFVIHHSLPKSMENFYQESGRAGRDDGPATCVLFYRFPDVFRQSSMVFTEQKGLQNLYAMVAYCLDLSRCRRALIAQHFDERWELVDCDRMCDHCENSGQYEEKTKDISREYRTVANILDHCNRLEERLTSQKLIEAWQGRGPPKLRPPDLRATAMTRDTCERILGLLLVESYLTEEFHFTPYSTISYINTGSRTVSAGQELLFPMTITRIKSQNDKLSSATVPSHSNKNYPECNSSGKERTLKASESSSFASSEKKSRLAHTSHSKKTKELSLQNGNKQKAPKKRLRVVVSSDEDSIDCMEVKKVKPAVRTPEKVVLKEDSDDVDDSTSADLIFDDYNYQNARTKKSDNLKVISTVTVSDSD